MTQPHYIDREAVETILRNRIYLQRIDDDCRVVGYEDATDAILALSAPMEAVAWREALEEAAKTLEHVDGALMDMADAGAVPAAGTWRFVTEAAKRARQALAVIPTQGPPAQEIQDAMDALRPLGWTSEDSLRQGALRALADATLQKEREG